MKLSDNIRESVWSLPEYIPGEYREGCIKLASNENNWGPSPKVVNVLRAWSKRTHLYPYQDDEVRNKLAKYAGVGLDNIVLGNGSDELMDMAVKVFKGKVAGSYPSFSEYPIVAGAAGETYVSVRLEDDFTFNAERFLQEAANCRLAFLCSPNNPTGLSIPDEALKAVLDCGKVVVLDEAYYEFSGKTRVKWIKDYPNIVILRTMSKAFALAGLRIGYAIADPEAVKAMLKVKIPFNVNSLAEAAALAALDDIPYSKKCVKNIVAARETFYRALSKRFKAIKSESNFVFADVSPMSAQDFFDKMVEKNIIVRKFGKFKGYPGEYIRISPGTASENKKFLKALGNI
jgi:histidinol-phosphate aminotransferase